ncbi:MAG: hypothetical protein QF535_14340 [Anaerolineales bacterium]|jgi:hypothetical protein|nr:hypothetical protein [Anaerolineales bacterium]|tara:strand:+ start:13 stop:1404 length:1392 start_codon:yes stop_codon:yes gene_type:complete
MANDMQFAGDFQLEHIIIHSATEPPLDIKPLWIELNVYESINSSQLSGDVSIADSANHLQNIPIVGQEEIEFVFGVPDNEMIDFESFRGRIYKVDSMVRTDYRQQVYTIHFTSKESIVNHRTRLNLAYEDTGDVICDSILRDVIQTNKALDVEPSDLKVKLLGNNMKPFSFIRMLSKRCRSREFEGAGYLFFENHRGYNFRSWESLVANNNGPREHKMEYEVSFSEVKDVERDMHFILDYRVTKNQDFMAARASGLLASTHYIYNMHTKTYEKKEHRYHDVFEDRKHNEDTAHPLIGAHPLFTDTPVEDTKRVSDYTESRLMLSNKDEKLHMQDTDDERNYDNHSNIKQDRLHDSVSHDQLVVKCTVPGNSVLAAGDIVLLNLPSFEHIPTSAPTERYNDLYLSGRWILTNVVHAVSPKNYSTTFDCVKDSVPIPYASGTTPLESNKEPEEGTQTLNTPGDIL